MKLGWPISIILHLIWIVGGLWMFSRAVEDMGDGSVIHVDMVTLEDETNVRASLKSSPENPKTDVPMELETPMPNAPDEGNPQERSAEASVPDVSEAGEFGEETIREIKPKDSEFDLDEMSALINLTRESQEKADQQLAPEAQEDILAFDDRDQASAGDGTALTIDEKTALQNAMKLCWKEPVAASRPETLTVRVKIYLARNGQVANVISLDRSKIDAANDPFLNAAENNALSAVKECAPYDFLPAKKYDSWREIIYTFKPKAR